MIIVMRIMFVMRGFTTKVLPWLGHISQKMFVCMCSYYSISVVEYIYSTFSMEHKLHGLVTLLKDVVCTVTLLKDVVCTVTAGFKLCL